MSRDDIIEKIRAIASNEKFKHDAYFLCGFATDKPNSDLLDACESYLEAVDDVKMEMVQDALNRLLSIMEKHLATCAEIKVKGNILENADDIKSVLDNRNLLAII